MKFTDGYWQIKKGITPLYAVEYAAHRVNENELTVYAPGRHVSDRGDCLNLGMLTVRLTSPMDDVIKVSISHFEGQSEAGPHINVCETKHLVQIREDQNQIEYRSGNTRAVINKTPSAWRISFYDGERMLTDTGFRNMSYMTNETTGKCYMVEQLGIDVGELIYGLGERFTPFVKNGQIVDIWNEDGGTASEIAYKNIPFYLTNKGYGVLVDSESDVSFEIGSEKVERVQFSAEGEYLSYYFINGGTPKKTIEKYTDLTGKPALPPAWSFGLWLSTSFTTSYDEETVTSFIHGMEEREIPLQVFHFDCYWMEAYEWCNFEWDKYTFPDPRGMIERYHKRGLRVCVWINPYIAQKSSLFKEGVERGFFLKKKNGCVWQTDMWQAGMAVVDFTNPEAVKWYQEKLSRLLDMGVDCFKTDFGERIPVRDIEYYNHADPLLMHNYYTYLYNQAVFSLLEEKRGRGEAVVFARSATVGGQKFPVHWGGDCSASYPSMAETLRSGLSLACSGFGFWSHDIGGFENTASADVYKRWCAFGLLSSHSRLHGSSSYRVPWMFDEEACRVLKYFVNLKCTLMPYLYMQALKAHVSGIPMMRPMFLEFPDDRGCETLDRQYMLGDTLLVAPVFKEDGEVEYYLPKGKWVHLLDGRGIEGGCWKKEKYDYFSLPLFIRPNSILAIGEKQEQVSYEYKKNVKFLISSMSDGEEASTCIPDPKGNIAAKLTVIRKDDQLTLIPENLEEGTWSYKVLDKSMRNLTIVCAAEERQRNGD